jgi:exopolyphosphatase
MPSETPGGVIVVPIVSISRLEIKLRPDVLRLLDLAGLTVSDLIYIDDELISTLLLRDPSSFTNTSSTKTASSPIIPSEQLSLILVDHNRLRSSLTHLSNNVIEIVDHHEDEGCYLDTVPTIKRNIAFHDGVALVASTCTLVVERLFNITPTTSSSSSRSADSGDSINRSYATAVTTRTIDASLGVLLLGVILLDSINMSEDAGKGTARDDVAISLLYQYTDWSSNTTTTYKDDDDDDTNDKIRTIARTIYPPPNGRTNNAPPLNRNALFTYLQNAKFDNQFWYSLSVTDCFKLDYKKFTVPIMDNSSASLSSISIGLSTVLISMNELIDKPNFYNELTSFVTLGGVVNTNDYDNDDKMLLFGIQTMTFSEEGDDGGMPIRGLLLASTDNIILESFTNYLITSEDAKFLEFTEIMIDDCNGNDWWKKKHEDDNEELLATSNNISVRIFKQGNGKGSRKQVAPTLLKHASAKWGGGFKQM